LFGPCTTRFTIKMSGFAQAVSIRYDAARGEAEPFVKACEVIASAKRC